MKLASILVIDDAETTREFFRGTLGDSHDLTLCENWKQARASFDEDFFDLVYLDCWLPDREGVAILEKIREFYEGPTVLISGYADRSIIEKARSFGIEKYLEKPFEPETIRRTTESILEGDTDEDPLPDPEESELPEDLTFYDDLKVLVVDDEESTRDLLSHPFEHYELTFRVAEDADTAWSIYRTFRPNVVILDARLPDGSMSSSDLLRKIRSEGDETFVVGITGYPESEEFEEFDRDELAEFYYKPFPIRKLLRTLSYLSFVIHKRNNTDTTETDPSSEEPEQTSSTFRQKIIIGLAAVLIGLTLGFVIKWTRSLARTSTSDGLTVEKMFQRIEGYLERDERRERREQ